MLRSDWTRNGTVPIKVKSRIQWSASATLEGRVWKEYREVDKIIQIVHGSNGPDPDLDKFFQVISVARSDSAKDPYGLDC